MHIFTTSKIIKFRIPIRDVSRHVLEHFDQKNAFLVRAPASTLAYPCVNILRVSFFRYLCVQVIFQLSVLESKKFSIVLVKILNYTWLFDLTLGMVGC